MKNLFLLCLFCLSLYSTLSAEDITVKAVQNIDQKEEDSGKLGDIIALQIQSNSIAPLLDKAIYLYIDGKRTAVQSFLRDTTAHKWFFRLDGKALGTSIPSFTKPMGLKLGLGTYDNALTTNVSENNFTLNTTTTKAKLLQDSLTIALNDVLEIRMTDPIAFNQLMAEKSEGLSVYLNNIPMTKSQLKSVNVDENSLTFLLDEDEVIQWFYNPLSSSSDLQVSLGTKTEDQFDVAGQLQIKFYSFWDRLGGLGIPLLAFIGLFWLSSNTKLIRDNIPDMEYPPFSFSRTQLAFWTFIIISSFVFIWFTTKELAFFPNSALILLGLSVTVTATARVIDYPKSAGQKLLQKPLRMAKNDQTSWSLFFNELLADGGSMSIHRLQSMAFNVFLGFVFFREVWYKLEMPSFSTELLALMGVSAAAYVGVKNYENADPTNPPATPPPAAPTPTPKPTPPAPTPTPVKPADPKPEKPPKND